MHALFKYQRKEFLLPVFFAKLTLLLIHPCMSDGLQFVGLLENSLRIVRGKPRPYRNGQIPGQAVHIVGKVFHQFYPEISSLLQSNFLRIPYNKEL